MRGRGRALLERAFDPARRARRVALVHLVVREQIIALLALVRWTDTPFDARDVVRLRALAPELAVADALHQALDRVARAATPARLVCLDQRLTARQRTVIEHVALGHTNAEIGRALGISTNTARNLVAQAAVRLGASNRADLVRLAVLR